MNPSSHDTPLQFLLHASKQLASTLDYKATLDNLAKLIVPQLADWFTIDVVNEKGEIELLTVTHVDASKVSWAKESRKKNPPPMHGSHGLPYVIETGKSELYSNISDEMFENAAQQIGINSIMIVPLIARDKTLGAVTFVTSKESNRSYTQEDLKFAEEFAFRAAIAIDNARLFQTAQQEITERKTAELALQAEEQRREHFLSIASHELKTPLTSIKAFTQLLNRYFNEKNDTKAIEYLSRVDNQIGKLTNLVEDLLDVSKIQAGKFVFNEEVFEFDELVTEVICEIQPTATKHIIKKKGEAKVRVFADKYRISQVITNLITNAIKYSPEAKEVRVKTTFDDENVIVAVEDFGIGIPKNQQQKIFERFFRVEGKKRESFPGLGLGLFISSEIIKRHTGIMWVESEEGKGSTFYFTLPIRLHSRLITTSSDDHYGQII